MVNEELYISSPPEDQYSEIPSPPRPDRKAGGWRSIKYILGNESFEKLASISLVANITVYLSTKYNMSGIFLVTVVNVWSGSSNISSLGGAFVSDAYLGKFYTLLFGSIASLLGMGVMTLTAGIDSWRPVPCDEESGAECTQEERAWQLGVVFAALGLLSIGAGGIRPCNIAFGADQFDTKTPKGKAQLESFFNWWYFTFTIALIIALTGVIYVQTNISWTLGFAIPTACLVFSILIFLIGYRTYVKVKPHGSVFSDIIRVLVAAFRKRGLVCLAQGECPGPLYCDPDDGPLVQTNKFKALDKAAVIVASDEVTPLGLPKDNWRLCTVQQVEQVKCLIAVLPVGVSGVGALMTMDQINTFGILQALQMDRSIGGWGLVFPPGWLWITSMIALSAWILIYERAYLPWVRRDSSSAGRRDKRLSVRHRILVGIILSILSMLVSSAVEANRRKEAGDRFVSPVNVTWLFPQFVLAGLTEAFAAVAVMEFLTMQLAENMRTVAGALFFLCLSIANYSGSIMVNLIHSVTKRTAASPWLGGHDLNKNRLDLYYFFLAVLAVLNLIYFVYFAMDYVLSSDRNELGGRGDGEDFEDDHSRQLE